ncbi:ACT domain-containing protein [Aminirod propionatiphilus]|uniref:ACT domain-containing protein n=1 Tax=Aminirod propionatiphilus TaxID=3415223 RepID=A0ACD1DV18_9BACT|nr:ACT domain-containing protein [Synergistota bacterium]
MDEQGTRAVITVVGQDRVGIIAGITAVLAEKGANILDISQTIVSGFFSMITVADISGCTVGFSELKETLQSKGLDLGVQVTIQHEDVFRYMHRI